MLAMKTNRLPAINASIRRGWRYITNQPLLPEDRDVCFRLKLAGQYLALIYPFGSWLRPGWHYLDKGKVWHCAIFSVTHI